MLLFTGVCATTRLLNNDCIGGRRKTWRAFRLERFYSLHDLGGRYATCGQGTVAASVCCATLTCLCIGVAGVNERIGALQVAIHLMLGVPQVLLHGSPALEPDHGCLDFGLVLSRFLPHHHPLQLLHPHNDTSSLSLCACCQTLLYERHTLPRACLPLRGTRNGPTHIPNTWTSQIARPTITNSLSRYSSPLSTTDPELLISRAITTAQLPQPHLRTLPARFDIEPTHSAQPTFS